MKRDLAANKVGRRQSGGGSANHRDTELVNTLSAKLNTFVNRIHSCFSYLLDDEPSVSSI